jgi:superfamily II DNA or RNA helicase
MHVYPDIFQKIGEFLESDDLFSMALTCKAAYRAFHRPDIQSRISWPLVKPKRLTLDQRQVIREMESVKPGLKLIYAEVGSGKSIVSLAYAFRNNYEKIVIVVPPNLITMWTKTCKDFFGTDPLVLHNSNPKYNRRREYFRKDAPTEKVILISFKIFDSLAYNWKWVDNIRCVCIVDEAHHQLHNYGGFKEIIGLSATAFRKDGLSYGVKRLVERYDVSVDKIIFKFEKTVIASKLPEIVKLDPHMWPISEKLVEYILKKKTNPIKGDNDLRDLKWISEVLSHPYITEMDTVYLGGSISVGKKSFHIPSGNSELFRERRNKFELENGIPGFKYESAWDTSEEYIAYQRKRIEHIKLIKEYDKKYKKFEEEYTSGEINRIIRTNPKYRQCLSICEFLRKRGEKGIIFDINITYLPFLYKYLTDRGVVCYMFSTHYDVASRQKQLEKFKSDPDAQVLLSSISMLGEGHNITEANHLIFLSAFSEENKYYQAIGRCHRYPQQKKVYVHYLFNSQFDRMTYEHSQGRANLSTLNWEKLLRS